MAKVEVKYNPYRLQTDIKIDGSELEKDSILQKFVKEKRLQEWIGDFPKKLQEELNTKNFDISFYGMELDWDDFEESFQEAKKRGIIGQLKLHFVPAKSNQDIEKRVVQIFNDLQEGPVEEFRDPKLKDAFDKVNNNTFPINVIATMSSGKSTLINALLEKQLMPSKNQACTAIITKIIDNDNDKFTATVLNKQKEVIDKIDDLDYETMDKFNSNSNVDTIIAHGNIPFLDSDKTKLMLVDTPGPNNAQNQEHKATTYRVIQSDANNLILYVLNGTQLGIKDDDYLLSSVAEEIKKGGKQVRDRFLFVINKMDGFNPEEESIEKAIEDAKKYLAKHGIYDPQIFPCSAFTALNLRTHLKDIDIDNLTPKQQRTLSVAARDTIPLVYKFIDYKDMHLEKYSVISPTTKKEIEKALETAKKEENIKTEALIHCGIYSIEAAITAYVKKYAQTKKVKDLIETFQEVLNTKEIFEKAKDQIANDEELARKFAERSELIQKKIDDGNEAKKFKEKVENLNPMYAINQKIEDLTDNVRDKLGKVFKFAGDIIENKEEAKRLIKNYKETCSEAIVEMNVALENIIHREIVETGKNILLEYQETLNSFDEDEKGIKELDFNTVDLIKDRLQSMKDTINAEFSTENYEENTVDDVGETTEEERTYAVKVGREQVVVGSHEEKIGTRKVAKGQHKEKTGTTMKKNPERQGWGWFAFWKPKYVEEDIYTWVTDYEDEDVYATILDYDFRDVYEDRTETIKKYSLDVAKLQIKLDNFVQSHFDSTIESAQEFAEDQTDTMKNQFLDMIEELNEIIVKKYKELENCAIDKKNKEEDIERNKQILKWIEENKKEIDTILDI